MNWRRAALIAVVAAVYVARPWTCEMAHELFMAEPFDDRQKIDPKGIGIAVAWASTVLFALPFCWLLLSRPAHAPVRAVSTQVRALAAATLLIVGSPLIGQVQYLRGLPSHQSWPVILSSVAWFAVAAFLVARPVGLLGPPLPSALQTRPGAAWTLLALIAGPALFLT